MDRNAPKSTIRRFFAGLTEYTFCSRLGLADPLLVDYVSDLLARFVRSDEIFSVRGPTGRPLVQVTDMLAEAESRHGAARRKVHRHIGDFTLFWTGVYPEVAARFRQVGTKDRLIDYQAQGKRAYFIASTIPVEREAAPSSLLERLSHNFELCAFGLSEVRRQWELQQDEGPEPPLLID